MRTRVSILAAAIGLLISLPAPAQTAPAKFRGVFESVSYAEDLELTDVFFVTPETGYVSGASGTILKTTDSGKSWNAQLGGDPASEERAVRHLRFISATTGWATQITGTHTNLFRTQDGETWEQVGSIAEHYTDLAFTSPTQGVYATGQDVFRTQDGGRTWAKTYTCEAKAEVDGLARTLPCELTTITFASPQVGFAIGYTSAVALILKTEDGGASWAVVSVLEGELGRNGGLSFLDENTGYLRVYSGKSYRTTDGGLTWTGMPATTLGSSINFADPDIGWSFQDPCVGMGCENARLTYTTDGGKRWATRSFPLPAQVKAMSFPRRDIAYVIGDHGMIFRYRSLPESATVAPKAIAAVPMPPLENAVLGQLAQVETKLGTMEALVQETEAAGGSVIEVSALPQLAPLEASVDAISQGVPQMARKHRNLNLVLVGLQLVSELSSEGTSLKQSVAGLRGTRDLPSLSAALTELRSQVGAMKAQAVAFRTGGM